MGEGRRKQLGESRGSKRPDPEPLPDLSAFINDRFFFGDTVHYPPIRSQNRDAENANDDEDHDEEEDEYEKDEDEYEKDEDEEEEMELNRKSLNDRDNGRNLSRRTQEWLEEARQVVSSSPARRSFHSQQSSGPSILNYARHEHLSRSGRRSVDSAPLLSASAKLDSRQNFSSSRFTGTTDFSDSRPNFPSSRFTGASEFSDSRSNFSSRFSGASDFSDSRPNFPSSRLTGTSDFSDSRPNLPSSRFNGASNSATFGKENNRSEKKGAGVQKSFGNILKKWGSQTEQGDSRSSRPPVPGRLSNVGHNALGDVLGKKHGNGGKEKYSNGGKEDKLAVGALSPPRRSVHIHVRSGSGSGSFAAAGSGIPYEKQDVSCLNTFLKKQRDRVKGGSSILGNVKIVLSASNPSTSSMVAAIGYAWLLAETGEADTVPVINMKRTQMRYQKQAACLFHHLAIDARSLLFEDEVDMESFSRSRKLNVIVIGQDALHNNTHHNDNEEVDSSCTLLIDEYYQRGYKLLEAPYLRELLLAGILLDIENSLDCAKRKDAQAIDLLLIDSSPDHKNNLLQLLNEKHKDDSFEEVLRSNYGEPIIKVKSQATPTSSSTGKNIISQTLSKWFGFGSKK